MTTRSRAPIHSSAKKSGRSQSRSRWWWRSLFESRLAAWSLLGIAVIGLAAISAAGILISVGRHHCADLCIDREHAFKDYAPASWFGTQPAVCTCIKEGVVLKLPMR